MTYTPIDWQDGVTPVDEAHLDHIEQGVLAADANALAALAALPGKADAAATTTALGLKEDKASKGAANGYAPLGADSKVPATNLPAAGASVPALVEGKWLKVQGGAMLWADVVGAGVTNTVSAANTDLAFPGGTTPATFMSITTATVGASLRSVGAGSVIGQRLLIRNGTNNAFYLLENGAGGSGAAFRLRDVRDVTLASGESVEFYWQGTWWIETGRNLADQLAYAEKTTDTSIPATTQAGATTIVTAAAVVVAAGEPVRLFSQAANLGRGANNIQLVIFRNGSYLTTLQINQGTQPVMAAFEYRDTPGAGTHTYSLRAWVDSATGTVSATSRAPTSLTVRRV